MWGALVALGDHYGANRMLAQQAFEDQVGRSNTFERVYYNWDDSWPTAWDYWSRDQGHQLLISWNGAKDDGSYAKWADIASGKYDDDIDRHATGIKNFQSKIYFIFHHEPEGDPNGTSADFINAWRHIHDRFTADGVTNIDYVLTLMAYTYRYTGADPWYPGSSYVDYVAADGYNWYHCDGRNDPWQEFDWIFEDFYAFGQEKGKKMFVAEWGTGEDPLVPGRKAAWIANAAATIKSWPDIEGVTYYDNGYNNPGCSRWIDTSLSSLLAFKLMGSDPYFNPTEPDPPAGYPVYVGAEDNDFTPAVGDLAQGDAVDFLITGPSSHTITDDSGMGWFDSRTKLVNANWAWTFNAAGNYPYKCTLHAGMTGTIKIPILATPPTGKVGTTFTVTWAAAAPSTGYDYDVQIQRPDDSWENWKTDTTTRSATFVPDSGVGTYSFKARLERNSDGDASYYSQSVSITVTR